MRLPVLIIVLLSACILSSVCTAMVCVHLLIAPRPAPGAVLDGQPLPLVTMPTTDATETPATQPPARVHAPQDPAPVATVSADAPATLPDQAPSALTRIPDPPPPLDEIIPPPPQPIVLLPPPGVAPRTPSVGRSQPTGPASLPADAEGPAPPDQPDIIVQHQVDEAIYRDYFNCTQAEVVVINTYQRCYQFQHEDIFVICLVARYAGVPLSVVFRTFYDDDHCSIQALITGYQLDPVIFFVDVPATVILPKPYIRPYHLFGTRHGAMEALSNVEYRELLLLKIAGEFQGRTPSQFFADLMRSGTPALALYRPSAETTTASVRTWSGASARSTPVRTAAPVRPTRPENRPMPAADNATAHVGDAEPPRRPALAEHDATAHDIAAHDEPSRDAAAPGERAHPSSHGLAPADATERSSLTDRPPTSSGQRHDTAPPVSSGSAPVHRDVVDVTPAATSVPNGTAQSAAGTGAPQTGSRHGTGATF